MGRKRSPDSLLNYFPEEDMVKTLELYKQTKADKYFDILKPKLVAVINGMINKEFSYNEYIKTNRDVVTSECLFAIIQSYNRFDTNKGRLFAYTNRIIKNTLLKCYNKNIQIKKRESTYTDINSTLLNSDDIKSEEDNIFNVSLMGESGVIDDTYTIHNALETVMSKSHSLDVASSMYIIYDYVKYIKDAVDYFLEEKNFRQLIHDSKFESEAKFDFSDYYNRIFTNQEIFYRNLLENIQYTLTSVLDWIRCNYSDVINKEPENYNGNFSNRAIGSVKRFIISSFAVTLGNKIDSDELVNFIKYITYKRWCSDIE